MVLAKDILRPGGPDRMFGGISDESGDEVLSVQVVD